MQQEAGVHSFYSPGSDCIAARSWPAQRALALADLAAAPAVCVIAVATAVTPQRSAARLAIRTALRQLLGSLLGLAPESVPLHCEPGKAPRLDLPGQPYFLSISHEQGLVLAAVRKPGPVGIDHMRTPASLDELPGWEQVAADYLGPQTLQHLQALQGPLARQPGEAAAAAAFAQAWTHAEASLKCAGLGLQEWDETQAGLFCRPTLHVQLGDGWTGSLVHAHSNVLPP